MNNWGPLIGLENRVVGEEVVKIVVVRVDSGFCETPLDVLQKPEYEITDIRGVSFNEQETHSFEMVEDWWDE